MVPLLRWPSALHDPKLHARAARVVTVTSMAHAYGRIRFDDLHARGYDSNGRWRRPNTSRMT